MSDQDTSLLKPASREELEKRLAESGPKDKDRKTILIIDDSPTTLQTAQFILARKFKVLTAEDGLEGLQRYHIEKPDIVFLDISMPKINGHKVLQEIRKLNPNAYVVMLSGNAFKDEIVKAQEEGAQGFVCKPFSKEHLDHAIEKWRTDTGQK